MEKYYKISLIIFPIILIIVILYSSIALYLHDPLQIWHKPFFRKNFNTYSYTMRESARAVIRDYDFDSVIIGNSHSENTSSKRAGEILGNGKFVNLSVSGSTTYEKKIILDYLFKNKNIKQVVYFLDANYLAQNKENKTFPIKNYDMLYNNTPYDDFRIYLNDRYFFCSLLFQTKETCTGKALNIDKPYAWDNEEDYKKRFGGFENWIKNKNQKEIKDLFKSVLKTPKQINIDKLDVDYILKSHEYMDNYLYSVIKNNENVQFYIVIPPVTDLLLSMQIRDKKQSFLKSGDMLKFLVNRNKNFKNVELYAFDDGENIGDIKFYKDRTHFNTDINYFILNSIAKKEHILTEDNINEYLQKVEEKAKKVDFDYYYDKIQKVKGS